jgi:hypothetical protein
MGYRDFFSRNRKFESISLQRRVACEPDFRGVITRCGGRCRTTKAEYGPLTMPGKRQVADGRGIDIAVRL